MGKISNKVKYTVKSPVVSDDYLTGTDSEEAYEASFVGEPVKGNTKNRIEINMVDFTYENKNT